MLSFLVLSAQKIQQKLTVQNHLDIHPSQHISDSIVSWILQNPRFDGDAFPSFPIHTIHSTKSQERTVELLSVELLSTLATPASKFFDRSIVWHQVANNESAKISCPNDGPKNNNFLEAATCNLWFICLVTSKFQHQILWGISRSSRLKPWFRGYVLWRNISGESTAAIPRGIETPWSSYRGKSPASADFKPADWHRQVRNWHHDSKKLISKPSSS